MKSLIVILVVLLMGGLALANPVPDATFDNETCLVTIHPNGNALDGWFLCVTDGQFIGLHHETEIPEVVECELRIYEFPEGPIKTVDMSPYVDCGIATAVDQETFGYIKAYYYK